MIVVDRARHALADHQHVGLIMESNPGFHDPGPKPTTMRSQIINTSV